MSKYAATINTPGYLPMDDEPALFETAQEAWEYLAELRERDEDDATETYELHDPRRFLYSETYDDLRRRASGKWLVCDFERVGTVYGETPGYEGEHDLGLAYSVSEVE